jgi:hypothetical protein
MPSWNRATVCAGTKRSGGAGRSAAAVTAFGRLFHARQHRHRHIRYDQHWPRAAVVRFYSVVAKMVLCLSTTWLRVALLHSPASASTALPGFFMRGRMGGMRVNQTSIHSTRRPVPYRLWRGCTSFHNASRCCCFSFSGIFQQWPTTRVLAKFCIGHTHHGREYFSPHPGVARTEFQLGNKYQAG